MEKGKEGIGVIWILEGEVGGGRDQGEVVSLVNLKKVYLHFCLQ